MSPRAPLVGLALGLAIGAALAWLLPAAPGQVPRPVGSAALGGALGLLGLVMGATWPGGRGRR